MSSNFEFLREVKVEGFYAIKSIALGPFSAENRWIFLTGENGYGKTLLLEAIALSLHGRDEATISTLEGGQAMLNAYTSPEANSFRRDVQRLEEDVAKLDEKLRIILKDLKRVHIKNRRSFYSEVVKFNELYDRAKVGVDAADAVEVDLEFKGYIERYISFLESRHIETLEEYRKHLDLGGIVEIKNKLVSLEEKVGPFLNIKEKIQQVYYLVDNSVSDVLRSIYSFLDEVLVMDKMLLALKERMKKLDKIMRINKKNVIIYNSIERQADLLESIVDQNFYLISTTNILIRSFFDLVTRLYEKESLFLGKDHPSVLASILEKKDTKAKIYSSINYPAKNVIAYGSSRLVPREVVKEAGVYNMVRSLFKTGSALRDIEDEYMNWYVRQSESSIVKARYESVKNLFEEVIPELELVIRKDDSRSGGFRLDYKLQNENTDNELLAFDRLSAGYRNILAILGDLVLNLYELQPTVTDIKALGGIVLIDELELHLHPKWQHKLPKLLSDAFPNVQFIASTHSPIPLLGAPEGAVFLKVDRDQERGIFVERLEGLEKEIEDLLPNTVLSSPLFGLKDLRSIKHKEENPVKVEDDYAEIERKAALEDALNKRLAEFDFSEDLKKEQDEKGE